MIAGRRTWPSVFCSGIPSRIVRRRMPAWLSLASGLPAHVVLAAPGSRTLDEKTRAHLANMRRFYEITRR